MMPEQPPDPDLHDLLTRAADTLDPIPPPLETVQAAGRRRRHQRAAVLTGVSLAVVAGLTATAFAAMTPASQLAEPAAHPTPTAGTPSKPTSTSPTSRTTAAACTLHQLNLTWSTEHLGIGMQNGIAYFLLAENRSQKTCTVSGTPTLQLVTPAVHVDVQPANPPMPLTPRGPKQVVLHPGQRAGAILWQPGSTINPCNGVTAKTWRVSLPHVAGSRITHVPAAAYIGYCPDRGGVFVSRLYSAQQNPGLDPKH